VDDHELQVIHDLGPAGRSKGITEGVIATMKALEVATVLNNASIEGEIRVNALSKESLKAKLLTRGQLLRSVTTRLLL